MPYQLSDFNGVTLPAAMTSDDLSTGKVESTLDNSIGGVFDSYGSSRRYPGRHEFTHKGLYEGVIDGVASGTLTRITTNGDTRVTPSGDTRIVSQSAIANLRVQSDALKAQIGLRGQLFRTRLRDGLRSWKTCRLLEVKQIETVEQASVVSEVQSTYETAMNGWHDAAATTASGSASAGVTLPLVYQNSGLLPVHDAVLTIARTSGTITQVTVTGANIDITWTGSLGSGQTLTIDAGAQTVQVNGADAYSGFVLGPTVNHWLPLPVGTQVLFVTVTGGNATATLTYYNQWP